MPASQSTDCRSNTACRRRTPCRTSRSCWRRSARTSPPQHWPQMRPQVPQLLLSLICVDTAAATTVQAAATGLIAAAAVVVVGWDVDASAVAVRGAGGRATRRLGRDRLERLACVGERDAVEAAAFGVFAQRAGQLRARAVHRDRPAAALSRSCGAALRCVSACSVTTSCTSTGRSAGGSIVIEHDFTPCTRLCEIAVDSAWPTEAAASPGST